MKKVALLNPGLFRDYGIHEPISLGYIAAYLEKHNIPVKIIDQLAGDYSVSRNKIVAVLRIED